jgi:hypothetical protein
MDNEEWSPNLRAFRASISDAELMPPAPEECPLAENPGSTRRTEIDDNRKPERISWTLLEGYGVNVVVIFTRCGAPIFQ